jgi:hypothetical protein
MSRPIKSFVYRKVLPESKSIHCLERDRYYFTDKIKNFNVFSCLTESPIKSTREVENMLCSLSTKLGQQDLEHIKSLEKEVGKTILSFTCHEVKPASLNEDQINKIKNFESQIGVSLVAVES